MLFFHWALPRTRFFRVFFRSYQKRRMVTLIFTKKNMHANERIFSTNSFIKYTCVCVCAREISGQQAVSIDRKNIENNNSNSNNAV